MLAASAADDPARAEERLMDQGMRPSRIVTHTLPLSQWETGFDLFEAKEAVKVILQPDDRYQGNQRAQSE